jgi:tryptophan-rich sensory protein
MVEFLRHALGLCGEHHHPNIWHLIFSWGSIAAILVYAKNRIQKWFR